MWYDIYFKEWRGLNEIIYVFRVGQTYSKGSEVKKYIFFWTFNRISSFLLSFDIKFINNVPLKIKEALNISWRHYHLVMKYLHVICPLSVFALWVLAFHSFCSVSLKASLWLIDLCKLPLLSLPLVCKSQVFSWPFSQFPSYVSFLWD